MRIDPQRLAEEVAGPGDVAARRIFQAKFLTGIASGAQIVVMVGLYALWKYYAVPFWTAVEWCFTAGVTVYAVLGAAASLLLALARVHPVSLLMSYVMRMASVFIYGGLHYIQGLGIVRSAAVLGLLYLTSSLLIRRIEGRARHRLGV